MRNYSLGMKQRLGHRARAARRSRGADPRRAGQRPRPGRHPLDARPAEVATPTAAAPCCSRATCSRGRADRRRDDPHRPRPDRRPGRQEVAPRRGARGGHVAGDVARQHRPRDRARPARPPRRPDGRRAEGDRLDRGGRARRARGRDRAHRPPHRGRGPGGPVPRAHLGHGTGRCGRRTSAATAVPRRARARTSLRCRPSTRPSRLPEDTDEHRHRRSHPRHLGDPADPVLAAGRRRAPQVLRHARRLLAARHDRPAHHPVAGRLAGGVPPAGLHVDVHRVHRQRLAGLARARADAAASCW